MNIGIDIDGVIIDSERNFKFYADYWSYFKLNKTRKRFDTTSQELCFDWSDEELKFFYDKIFDHVTKNSKLMIGAKEIIKKLKEDGHKLYIVTLRGYYNKNEIKYAKKTIKKLGVKFDGIFWSTKDKISKCKELGIDIMLDDSAENVDQFLDSGISVLHFRESKIRKIKSKNVFEVDSWMDIYRTIKRIEKEKMKG